MGRRAAATAVLALVALLSLPPSGVRAQDGGWRIDTFAAEIVVRPDGSVRVIEQIAVDFAGLQRHGIFRVIPVKYDLAENTAFPIPEGRRAQDYQRIIDVDEIEVTSTAPADVALERPGLTGRLLRIRIGDEDRTVSGRHTYRISYVVRGALNEFEAHDELYWNVTGTEWEVPIQRATATVRAPAMRNATCFRGAVGATGLCDRAAVEGHTATFVARQIQPGEGLTVVAAFPKAAVEVPPPLIEERWTITRALMGSPAAIPGAVVVLVAGLGLVLFLAYRQGRDRITRDRSIAEAPPEAAVERRALFAPRITPVEFRPPSDLRPGQLGLLVDERVDPVDISATIVDLAVRGQLRITEIEASSWFRRTDWTLERLEAPDDVLLPYEERLLNGLFKEGQSVQMSSLKGTFSRHYQAVVAQLYEDGVRRKWFPRRPDSVRTKWLVIGVALTIVAVAAFVAAMFFTTWALAVAPLILVGVILTVAHRWMPHRTAAGSRLLDQALGFREFIVTADAGRAEYAEQQHLFIPYLPFAIMFGAVDKWARTFAELGAMNADGHSVGVGAWYVGAGTFDARDFSSGLSEFSSSIGAALPTAPPSSSGSSGFSGGGFSGGGFGGGGGGSW